MPKLLVFFLLSLSIIPCHVSAKVKRDPSQVRAFKRLSPCPANGRSKGSCPGWIVDHIKALACGGADSPANMQWQTVEQAKAKDRWELDECNWKSRIKLTKTAAMM